MFSSEPIRLELNQEPIRKIIVLGKNFDDEHNWREIEVPAYFHTNYDAPKRGALSNSTQLNTIAAVQLLRENPEMEAIFSTGITDRSGKYDAGESEAMLAYARKLCGNDPQIVSRIQLENKSINTDENAEFVHKILKDDGLRSQQYAILTTKYHLPRAVRRFERHFGEGSFCKDEQHIASEEVIKKMKKSKKLSQDEENIYNFHRFSRYRAKQIMLETGIHIAHLIAPNFTENLLTRLSASRGRK